MIKTVLTTIFYLFAYVINALLVLYLTRLESDKCNCVKNSNFHFALKTSIYVGILMPIVYVLLLIIALITNDNILYYSLQQVYRLLIIIVNGVITFMLFAYMHLLNKSECICVKEDEKLSKVHKTLNILRYIMLVGYSMYLITYINLKYFSKPKIILVNNVQKSNNRTNYYKNNNRNNFKNNNKKL